MSDLDPRPRQPPCRLGHRRQPFNPGDHIRARFEKTADYYPAVIIAIEDDGITVRFVHTNTFAKVPLDSVRRAGPDGEYVDGSANFGGSSSGSALNMPPAALLPCQTCQQYKASVSDTGDLVSPNVSATA